MSVIPFELISGLFALASFPSITVVILAFIVGKIAVNYAPQWFKLASETVDDFDTLTELVLKVLRRIALNHLLQWILNTLDNYCSPIPKGSLTYGHGMTLIFSMLIIIFYPDDLLVDEWIMIAIFTFIFLEKLIIICYIKWHLYFIKRFQQRASQFVRLSCFKTAILQYEQALRLYQRPFLAKNPLFNDERIRLTEQIGDIFSKQHCFDKALLRYQQALNIYRRIYPYQPLTGEPMPQRLQNKLIALQRKNNKLIFNKKVHLL